MDLDQWREYVKKRRAGYRPPFWVRISIKVRDTLRFNRNKTIKIAFLLLLLFLVLFALFRLVGPETSASAGIEDIGLDGELDTELDTGLDVDRDAKSVEDIQQEQQAVQQESKRAKTEEEKELVLEPSKPKGEISLAEYQELLEDVFDGYIIIGKDASERIRSDTEKVSSILFSPVKKSFADLEIGVDYVSKEDIAVSCKDLEMLCSKKIHNNFGEYTYNQMLYLPEARVEYRIDPDDKDDIPRPYLYQDEQNLTYRYRIMFFEALEGEVEIKSDTQKIIVNEIEGTELSLFGKKYLIARAYHPAQDHLKLYLIGGIHDILAEGIPKTYEINAREYTIESYISGGRVIFLVNGIPVGPLYEGGIGIVEGLKGGNKWIVANEVMGNEADEENGADILEFYFGDQIILEDRNTTTDSNFVGDTVVFNEEKMHFLNVDLVVTNDQGITAGDRVELKSIEIRYRPREDIYGWGKIGKITDELEGKKGTFLNLFEIDYRGALLKGGKIPVYEDIIIHPHGDENYRIHFFNKHGVKYEAPLFACTDATCGTIAYGKLTGDTFRNLVVDESENIAKHEYFFLRDNMWTHLFKNDGVDSQNRVVHLRDMTEDEEKQRVYEVSYDANGIGYFDMDISTHLINVTDGANQIIQVDMDGDGSLTDTSIMFRTKTNGDILLDDAVEPMVRFRSNELYESSERSFFNFTPNYDQDEKRLDINRSDVLGDFIGGFNATNFQRRVSRGNDEYGMTEWGYVVQLTDIDNGDQSTLSITYPTMQLFGHFDVYGTVMRDIVKLDKKFVHTNMPMIIIGGPCENKLAARLAGNPEPCDKNLKTGVMLYENAFGEGQIAAVIAGRDAKDTEHVFQEWIGAFTQSETVHPHAELEG